MTNVIAGRSSRGKTPSVGENNNIYRIGCAGWNLPRELREASISYLERYSQLYNCVEINSSFYRHHQPKTYKRWKETVPDDFKFAVKIPKSVTHEAKEIESTIPKFLEETAELEHKLGPLLAQFPPGARFKIEEVSKLFSIMRSSFNGTIVCEPRHASWFEIDAFKTMADYDVLLVGADPLPVQAAPNVLDSKLHYLRLHGSPRIYYSNYNSEFISSLELILREASEETWAIFDNTAAGFAYQNAVELSHRLSTQRK